MIKIGNGKNYDLLIKILQSASVMLMLTMLVVALVLIKKYNISLKNTAPLEKWLSGSVLTVAAIMISFAVVKSFALVISPSLIFGVSGLVFDSLPVAILVNFIANALSVLIPYFLGKYTGRGMYESLKRRYPKVKKFDDFIGENEFVVAFLFKSTNIIPGDISSLALGAIGVDFKKFFIAANIGSLPLNILWALAGNRGDLSNPVTYLYLLPIFVFSTGTSLFIKHLSDKKKKLKSNG